MILSTIQTGSIFRIVPGVERLPSQKPFQGHAQSFQFMRFSKARKCFITTTAAATTTTTKPNLKKELMGNALYNYHNGVGDLLN